MPVFKENLGLSYDDVNLIAQYQCKITSRTQVPDEKWRIVVSPMAAIVGEKFTEEALHLGLSVCVPRFSGDKSLRIKCLERFWPAWRDRLFIAISLEEAKEFIKIYEDENLPWDDPLISLIDSMAPMLCLDVANGYLKEVIDIATKLVDLGYKVICGNVHDEEGFYHYPSNSIVRVGIGGGFVCKTSTVTGFTRGQISEIEECATSNLIRDTAKPAICADGGIRTSGDMMKAFGAGASYVMCGSIFKEALEAQNVIDDEFSYWGGASDKQQFRAYGSKKRHAEGVEKKVDHNNLKPLKDIVEEIWGGITSGVSYSGYGSLKEFIGNGVFEIKNTR